MVVKTGRTRVSYSVGRMGSGLGKSLVGWLASVMEFQSVSLSVDYLAAQKVCPSDE